MAFEDKFSADDLPVLEAVVETLPEVDLPLRLARAINPKAFPLQDGKALSEAVFAAEPKFDYIGRQLDAAWLLAALGATKGSAKNAAEAALLLRQVLAAFDAQRKPSPLPARTAEQFSPPIPSDWPVIWGRITPGASGSWSLRG